MAKTNHRCLRLFCSVVGLFAGVVSPIHAAIQINRVTYNQWPQSFTIGNGVVEAIVVPPLGRVMQFRFAGENEGPFWENHTLDGKSPDSQSREWINFGGDKTWPAPQGEWAKVTGRGWPPPIAFDSMPVDAVVQGDALVLNSKIDPGYGIRTERRIRLAASEPVLEIETTYRKVEGLPIRVAVWTITQFKDPEKVYLPVPKATLFPAGYNKQSDILPADLKVVDSLLSCTRSSKDSTKIGSDAGGLVWGDARWVVHIHAPREAEGEFPDQGSSAEIYTNPDPNKYVELETLGPLKQLKPGESLSRRQSYRLHRRTSAPLDEQVRSLLRTP